MKNFPLISVALCTYNGEKFLEKQVDSILNQTYPNYEVIIVDDNSQDKTWDILKGISDLNHKIEIYKNKSNIGYVKNFERALRLCKGEYIAMCDQDDIWRQDKLEILVNNISEHIMVYHDSSFINEDDEPVSDRTASKVYDKFNNQSNLFFLKHNSISGHASMFRKELLTYALPFDHRFYHDWWLAFVARSIGSILFVPEILVKHRQHNQSVTDPLTLRVQQKESKSLFGFDLHWVKYLSEFKGPNQNEINYIYETLESRKWGKKGLKYWFFLFKYYEILEGVDLSKKSVFSKVNLIRKIYFKS